PDPSGAWQESRLRKAQLIRPVRHERKLKIALGIGRGRRGNARSQEGRSRQCDRDAGYHRVTRLELARVRAIDERLTAQQRRHVRRKQAAILKRFQLQSSFAAAWRGGRLPEQFTKGLRKTRHSCLLEVAGSTSRRQCRREQGGCGKERDRPAA